MRNKVKQELINMYNNQCFLNGVIYYKNPITYHHIQAVRNGGKTTIENGALLGRLEHSMFNVIEDYNKTFARWLNEGFIEYKQTKNNLIILQMRLFVDNEIQRLGCEVEERKDILVLRRR